MVLGHGGGASGERRGGWFKAGALVGGQTIDVRRVELVGLSCACRRKVGHKADRRKHATRAPPPVLPRLPPGVRDDEGTYRADAEGERG